MRLKLSFLLVLIGLALFLSDASESGAPKPTPRESTKNHSQASDKRETNSDEDIDKPPIAERNQEKAYAVAANDKNKPESVRIAPIDINPLDIKKDWADYVFAVFSFLLVLIGGYQFFW